MIITKKLNYDSLWVKAANGKHYAKLFISRRGARVTHNDESMAMTAKKIADLFEEARKEGLNYEDTILHVEKTLLAV